MYHTYIIASCTKQAANRSVDQQGEGAYAWLTRVNVTSQKNASGCWPPKEFMQYSPQCFIPRHWNKCYTQHAMMGLSQDHNVNEAETRVLCFSSSKTLTSSSLLIWSLKGDNLISIKVLQDLKWGTNWASVPTAPGDCQGLDLRWWHKICAYTCTHTQCQEQKENGFHGWTLIVRPLHHWLIT